LKSRLYKSFYYINVVSTDSMSGYDEFKTLHMSILFKTVSNLYRMFFIFQVSLMT